MKSNEKKLARELRTQGLSFTEIRKLVPVSKGTLSNWVRDIVLTKDQINNIADSNHEKIAIAIKANRDKRWEQYRNEAETEWHLLNKDIEFMFGLALYIGEGNKTEGVVGISNCNPGVLRQAIKFFIKIGAESSKLKALVQVHSQEQTDISKHYWSEQLGLSLLHFNKVVIATSRASKRLRINFQPYGTCQVRVCNTKLLIKLLKWMELALAGPIYYID